MGIESKLRKAGVIAVGGLAFLTAYFAPDYAKGFAYAGGNPVETQEVSAADKKVVTPADTEAAIKYNRRGNLQFNKGRYDKAIKYFKMGIEEDPTYADNYGMLGECLLKKNENIDQVIELANKAIELSSHKGVIAYNHARLAEAYIVQGSTDVASNHLELYKNMLVEKNGTLSPNQLKDYTSLKKRLK